MTLTQLPWAVWCIMAPLLLAAACFVLGKRWGPLAGWLSAPLVAGVSSMLVWQVIEHGPQRYELGGWGAPLGIALRADGLSALMIAMTSAIVLIVSFYAHSYFQPAHGLTRHGDADDLAHRRQYFWPLWLLMWASMHALFLSNDLFNIYVTLEILGISSVALVSLAGGVALTAGMRYLFVTLTGSLFYLLGVALLYSAFGVLDLDLLGARVEAGPVVWAAFALMTVGLLLKTALFPLHFWLPSAHANAPAPVSALLSALVVKASFFLLVRLWLVVFGPLDALEWARLLGMLGSVAIIWGSIQALRQVRLKLLVAYSTVAQIGYLFVVFPLVAMGAPSAWPGGIYFVVSHAFAKAAMFLCAGTIARALGHDRIDMFHGVGKRHPVVIFAFGLAGISLMGLPPSGGYIAKWMLLSAAIETEQWVFMVVIHAGGLLAAAYVFRVLQHAFSSLPCVSPAQGEVPRAMELAPFVLAVIAILLGLAAPYPLMLMEIGDPFALATPAQGQP
ncbi:MAG: oxidoreductase [Bradymonadaceae bacterium]|nr:oxidoreductase [Lujinxingiaceae bacterium]